jgi:hypothetical protein
VIDHFADVSMEVAFTDMPDQHALADGRRVEERWRLAVLLGRPAKVYSLRTLIE